MRIKINKFFVSMLVVVSGFGVVRAATLVELIDQARTEGYDSYAEITRYLNRPTGFTTNITTNMVLKPLALRIIESNITNELGNVSISLIGAKSNGWGWVINRLETRYDQASNANQRQGVLNSSWRLSAWFERYSHLTGEAVIRDDFGRLRFDRVGRARIPLPSLAETNLGHKVTKIEVISADRNRVGGLSIGSPVEVKTYHPDDPIGR